MLKHLSMCFTRRPHTSIQCWRAACGNDNYIALRLSRRDSDRGDVISDDNGIFEHLKAIKILEKRG